MYQCLHSHICTNRRSFSRNSWSSLTSSFSNWKHFYYGRAICTFGDFSMLLQELDQPLKKMTKSDLLSTHKTISSYSVNQYLSSSFDWLIFLISSENLVASISKPVSNLVWFIWFEISFACRLFQFQTYLTNPVSKDKMSCKLTRPFHLDNMEL